ncbi:MAG: alpha-glucan phosphorylase, partial [Thiovulaceae bacterium]|nr:alpha-glucan phosphorylase [Sulfurimonadaceae bacterium]
GVLHLSVLDGWWPEGYSGENGWTFGGEPSNDAADATSLYDTIENEIVPLFYDVSENNIPHGWIVKMKESMMSVPPEFSARRMMNDYVRKFYVPISKELLKEEKE